MFVTENFNNRVSVFSLTGVFLRCFGCGGKDSGELDCPSGICLNPMETELFVCDSHNFRVQVFDLAGNFLRAWGTKGSDEGQLARPADVCVSADGSEVFVSEGSPGVGPVNHRVSVFTPKGQFLRALGRVGAGEGEVRCPCGIALTSKGTLLVCEYDNNRIQEIRCSDGAFVSKWGTEGKDKGEFRWPRGIAANREGEVYVCDSNHRIQVFI